MKKYLVYDSETGGLTASEASLLTATFRVLDSQLQQLDQLELKLKPDSGNYAVTAQAMKINGINLITHEMGAFRYKEARPQLLHFLNKHSSGGSEKLTPVGHNVAFDDSFIQTHLINKSEWEQHVSYRKLDTATVAEFLKICYIIPGSVSGSLGGLAQFFGIAESGAHDATVDVNMTANLLKAMKNRITK